MKFHPAAQIVSWCLLVVSVQTLPPGFMVTAAGLILLLATALSRNKFLQLVRRTRWIMLSLLLVYAYATPGQTLVQGLGLLGPSREGLIDGSLQLLRLATALASLALLLDRLSRQQLIGGLYTLVAPLQLLGLSRERLAVRLALTLHYSDVAALNATKSWGDVLRGLSEASEPLVDGSLIELPQARFQVRDLLLLGGAALLLAVAMQ